MVLTLCLIKGKIAALIPQSLISSWRMDLSQHQPWTLCTFLKVSLFLNLITFYSDSCDAHFKLFFFSLRLYMTYYSFGVWKFMWSKGLRCNITRRMSLYILFLMSFYTVEVWNWKLYVTLLMLFLSTSPRIILFR